MPDYQSLANLDTFAPARAGLAGIGQSALAANQMRQSGIQNKIGLAQLDSVQKKEKMERFNAAGKLAKGIMTLPPDQQEEAYNQATKQLEQIFGPASEPVPPFNPQTIDQIAKAYDQLNPPEYDIQDGQYVPKMPTAGAAAMAIPGFKREQKIPEGMRIGESGQAEWDPAYMQGKKELAAAGRSSGGGGTPYYTPVQTAQGVMSFNARTGRMEPVAVAGGPVVGSSSDPKLQGDISGAKAAGKIVGEKSATAMVDLPATIQEAEQTITLVDDLLKHPGFKQAVGTSSVFGVQNVPGTDAKAFMTRLDQLKGKQFLQAYQGLKGGGQITEAEGQKATAAISRMDNATTEKEFISASRDFQDVIRNGVQRAKEKSITGGNGIGRTSTGGAMSPQHGIVKGGYKFNGGNPADPASWTKVQ